MSRPRAIGQRFVSHTGFAACAGTALLAGVGLMAIAVPDDPLALDRRWSEAMHDIRTPFLTDIALIFNALGHGLGWLLSVAAIALLLVAARRPLALTAFLAVVVLTSVSSTVLKAMVGRPRPPDGLVDPLGSSFPSGHTSYAAATSVALVLLFTAPGRRRSRWWAVAAATTAGMAWSRTYLQVHWLSDVVGGVGLGVGTCLLTFAVAQRLGERSLLSQDRR